MELFRGIRSQMTSLISGLEEKDLKAMTLGLSHSLGRYKLKFSADKVCGRRQEKEKLLSSYKAD